MSLYTHLGFLAGLTGCAIWGIVQLLGNHTEELSLVFIPIVVRGADADQLEERHKLCEAAVFRPWPRGSGELKENPPGTLAGACTCILT